MRKKILLHLSYFYLVFLISHSTFAQSVALSSAEQMPSFPGGKEGLLNYLKSNLKYPIAAQKMKLQGQVLAKVVISEQGQVDDITIVKALGGGCEEEAIRLLENSPLWIPGKDNGKNVKVTVQVPIEFRLD